MEYETDLAVAYLGKLPTVHLRHGDAVERIFTGSLVIQSADDIHQCGFARTRRTYNGNKLPLVDFQADPVQDLQFVGRPDVVGFYNIVHFDNCLTHPPQLPLQPYYPPHPAAVRQLLAWWIPAFPAESACRPK